jgi:predicted nuclease with TOPRIM domain
VETNLRVYRKGRRGGMPENEKLDLIIQSLQIITERFDEVDERFDKVDERLDKMDERFDKVDERLDKMDERLDKMDERFDKVDEQIAKLKFMDEGILDEVVRVHHILEKHIHDPNAHSTGFYVHK